MLNKIYKIVVLTISCALAFLFCKTEVHAAEIPNPAYTISGEDYRETTNEGTTIWMKNGGYCSINAPDGYGISTDVNGTFGSSIEVSVDSVPPAFFLKNEGGEMFPVIVSESFKWDTTLPVGEISIDGTNQVFSEFVANPAKDLFYKEQKTFTVTGNDSDSGVKSIEYFVSDTPLDSSVASGSDQYTAVGANGKIECEMSGINYIYVRLTDQVGNQSVISTDGMIFYKDAQAITTELTYIQNSDKWVEVNVFPNGNTICQIQIGDTVISEGVDYEVNDDGVITFYPSAFSGLEYGTYSVRIQFNPLDYSYVDQEGNEASNDITMLLSVTNNKETWGTSVVRSGVTNYVSADGTTSAEVTGADVIWLKEEATGVSAWYALDNSSGIFPTGSRFWVKWIHADDNPTEWDYYYGQLDDIHKNEIEDNRSWIFLVGVTMPDGTEYTELAGEVLLYIQLGADWDKEDTRSCYISQNVDEAISVSSAERDFPEGNDTFATLKLRHFSPYILFDITKDQGDSGASGQDEPKQGEPEQGKPEQTNNATPNHNIPLTADTAYPMGWLGAMVLSLCGMLVVALRKRREIK
ncbi:MAG: hypothetical protein IJZ44_02510 [Lachnospiraceae bacterium]|nr:hypothetical protein [Lachnospiraceae bacterium]